MERCNRTNGPWAIVARPPSGTARRAVRLWAAPPPQAFNRAVAAGALDGRPHSSVTVAEPVGQVRGGLPDPGLASRPRRMPAGRGPVHDRSRRLSPDIGRLVRLRRRVRPDQHDARLREGTEHAARSPGDPALLRPG